MKTKVLYFPSNTRKNRLYYNKIYTSLKSTFGDRTTITVDEVDKFLLTFDEKFYVKELPYQLEIYNVENEYVFCINKPIV
jgi:hypothetical protein